VFYDNVKQKSAEVHRFETENDAVDLMVSALKHNGFTGNKWVKIPNDYGEIDIVANKVIDGKKLIAPIEAKSWFRNASSVSKAAFQAADYAHRIKMPVFLGPFYMANRQYKENMRQYLSFMCRMNVGAIFVDENLSMEIFLDPLPFYSRTYSEFTDNTKESVLWGKWGMREQFCSKSKMTPFYKGRYDG
jgi:Holliday junction resolvase-like predicted endonuclease